MHFLEGFIPKDGDNVQNGGEGEVEEASGSPRMPGPAASGLSLVSASSIGWKIQGIRIYIVWLLVWGPVSKLYVVEIIHLFVSFPVLDCLCNRPSV